jgi:hypothetical protein
MPAPKTDRREFLTRTTAAAAVLGFPFVGRAAAGAGDAAPADRPPIDYAALFAKARARMQAERKPGVVIVIPPGEDDAAALELAITFLLAPTLVGPALVDGKFVKHAGPAPATARLFSRAVFVALPRDEVQTRFPKADAKALCLILDAAGNVVDAVPAPAMPADAPERALPTAALSAGFIADMNARLDGPDGQRLTAEAQAQRAALGDGGKEIDRLLAGLRSEGSEQTREIAAQGLAKEATAAAAILLEKRKTAGPELAARIDGVFVAACSGLKADTPAPHLPYGVAWRDFRVFEGCGATTAKIGDREISLEAVAVACGLSRPGPAARRFLRFLGSPEAVVAAAAKQAVP